MNISNFINFVKNNFEFQNKNVLKKGDEINKQNHNYSNQN